MKGVKNDKMKKIIGDSYHHLNVTTTESVMRNDDGVYWKMWDRNLSNNLLKEIL